MKKVSILLVVALMLSAFMQGCGGGKTNDENALPEAIQIGVFEPWTGANSADGERGR